MDRKYNEKSFEEVFDTQACFEIPIFQRNYVWDKKKWEEIVCDVVIEELCKIDASNKKQQLKELEKQDVEIMNENYYFGSIYLKEKKTSEIKEPGEVSKYLIIDGQQRLITIYLFLIKIYHDLKSDSDYSDKIQDQREKLFLKRNEGKRIEGKLYTLKKDEQNLIEIITGNERFASTTESNIARFNRWYEKQPYSPKVKWNLFYILCNYLKITEIILSDNDDEMLIFENLNDKGTPLRGDELLCNYIFQAIVKEKNEKEVTGLHNEYWLDTCQNIERYDGINIKEEIFLFFLRTWFSIGENKMIGKDKDIYYKFKKKHSPNKNAGSMIKILEEIKNFSILFSKSIKPLENQLKKESDLSPEEIDKLNDILGKIDKLNNYTSLTFLLPVLKNFEENFISYDGLIDMLITLHRFLIRKKIANLPTNRDNILFPSLWNKIKDKEKKTEAMKEEFKEIGLFVSDEKLSDVFVSNKFYGHTLEKLVLKEIDKYLAQENLKGELPDYTTLNTAEHILPQIFDNKDWNEYLKNEHAKNSSYSALINNRIHTIGNLMLVGQSRNSELQNAIFTDKINDYGKNSGLSKDLIDNYSKKIWNVETIESRSKELAKIAVKIWAWF